MSALGIDDYAARFDDEPGYLDFARVAPIGRAALEEQTALAAALAHARFGALSPLAGQADRLRGSLAALLGLPAEQIVPQPSTSEGLLHAMFGITGGVALSPAEFPALTFAARRAADALGVLQPVWIETDHGRVTPGNLRPQLTSSIVAVAVSVVDFRTGYLADLDGIRQVIGDRLLIVDAAQGVGLVDAPWRVADVVVGCGYKGVRAGWGTGFLALSERAIDHLTPVWSGRAGAGAEVLDAVPPPARGAEAFQVSPLDPFALGRFAAAVDEIVAVGVPAIGASVAEKVSRIIDLADEFAVPVVSPRAEHERASIVVLEPEPDQLTTLVAALHNHGVAATTRDGAVRLSAHVSTDDETLAMLKAALLSFSTAV